MKKAYHRLIKRDGQVINGPIVVVFDENNIPISCHQLIQEEANTEWIGGEFYINDIIHNII